MPKKENKKVNDVRAEIKKIVKKKKRKVYFGQEVQDAIVEYNSSEIDGERNTIYGTRIHAAFDKLAENIISTFKFSYLWYTNCTLVSSLNYQDNIFSPFLSVLFILL